jgi:hypothetical protein
MLATAPLGSAPLGSQPLVTATPSAQILDALIVIRKAE